MLKMKNEAKINVKVLRENAKCSNALVLIHLCQVCCDVMNEERMVVRNSL